MNISKALCCQATKRPGSGAGTQKWIDSMKIYCQGGHGGNGLPQYGGCGGRGGSVIIKTADKPSKKNPSNLFELFKKRFKGDPKNQKLIAKPGSTSSKARLNGALGEDTVLTVPTGVGIYDQQRNLLKDLDEFGQEITIALGGQGGDKSNSFIGMPGQKKWIRLDLKLLADVGLVGFPNAGKSSLLNAISNARPKIANYPFTTLRPNLGHLTYPDARVVTMADLPGLIEGAHKNIGMGHRFLKHVERTKLLLFVVDIHGFQLGPEYPFRTAFETAVLLNKEIELYNPELLKKPAVMLLNKMDLPDSRKKLSEFSLFMDSKYEEALQNIDEEMVPKERLEFREIIPLSVEQDPKSLRALKDQLRSHLDDAAEEEEAENRIKELSLEVETALRTSSNSDKLF